MALGDSGEPRHGGEEGEPGESGMLSRVESDALLPVFMLILMVDLLPVSKRVGVSSD